MVYFHPNALGIEAASFWSAAEKDIAESPTASPERPKESYRVAKQIVQSSKFRVQSSKKSVVRCLLSVDFSYLCKNRNQ